MSLHQRSLVSRDASAGGFGRETRPRALEVGRSIDTVRHAVNERDFDPHAGFQSAQLLEALAPFQCRLGQRDEARQRPAAEGVETDMMIQRTVAPSSEGRRDAGANSGDSPSWVGSRISMVMRS